jgi:hypothetical protein
MLMAFKSEFYSIDTISGRVSGDVDNDYTLFLLLPFEVNENPEDAHANYKKTFSLK